MYDWLNYVGMQQGQVLMQGMCLVCMVHNCMVNNSAVISYKCGLIFLATINSAMQVESAQAKNFKGKISWSAEFW